MNPPELKQLARRLQLDREENFDLTFRFGIECAQRVRNLLVDDTIRELLAVGERYLAGAVSRQELEEAADRAAQLATGHQGSNSMDGSGGAAVSACHGVASALAGRALEAAEYAAYARVYSYASYAVTDLSAYADEHTWQVRTLGRLAEGVLEA